MIRWCPRASICLACLVLAACGAPAADPGASPASPRGFDPAQVRVGTDSFMQRFHWLPEGRQRYTLERTAAGYRFTNSFRFSDQLHRTVILLLDSAFGVRSVTSTANFNGKPASVVLVVDGDRVRGHVSRSTAKGPRSFDVDTVLPPGTVLGEALMLHILALPWEVGQTHTMSVYEADQETFTPYTLRVVAREAITVPAGTFDAYRAELSWTELPDTVWATRAVPRRLLKTSSEAGETVLVR